MKKCIFFFIAILTLSSFANAEEVCGTVKRLSETDKYPFSKIEFNDGNEISTPAEMGREALIVASMTHGLKLCFKYDGQMYIFSSASK